MPCRKALADGYADLVAPGVLETKLGPRVVRSDAGDLEPVREGSDVVTGRDFNQDLPQAQGVAARAGSAAVPDIHGHVVVVAAGRHEQRLAVPAGRLFEPKRLDVDVVGRLDVA